MRQTKLDQFTLAFGVGFRKQGSQMASYCRHIDMQGVGNGFRAVLLQ
jgi:hypothetical protein